MANENDNLDFQNHQNEENNNGNNNENNNANENVNAPLENIEIEEHELEGIGSLNDGDDDFLDETNEMVQEQQEEMIQAEPNAVIPPEENAPAATQVVEGGGNLNNEIDEFFGEPNEINQERPAEMIPAEQDVANPPVEQDVVNQPAEQDVVNQTEVNEPAVTQEIEELEIGGSINDDPDELLNEQQENTQELPKETNQEKQPEEKKPEEKKPEEKQPRKELTEEELLERINQLKTEERKPEVTNEENPLNALKNVPVVNALKDQRSRAEMFARKLKDFNSMYKTELDAEQFGEILSVAWENMTGPDAQKAKIGKDMISSLFKNMLKEAFKVEKTESYNEHRLPMYPDILKSANEVLRSAMFAHTDLYHNPERASMFGSTAFGGMSLKDIAKYTRGSELWRMDQKSDEAWKIQSKEAMEFVGEWKKEESPFEKMITDLNKIMELARSETGVSRRDAIMKLAAAEYLLINDDRMTIDDPEDPLNPIPNWGNRYWKKLIEVRETLGIDKHTSIRDMIQADYAAAAKGVNSIEFHEKQIRENVMGENALATVDSIDKQKELFATQSGFFALTEPPEEIVMTEDRVRYPIKELDQRRLMEREPKDFSRVIDPKAQINRDGPEQAPKGKK